MLNLLLPLLTSGTGIKSLGQILTTLLGGGSPKDAALSALKPRLDEQAGRTGGKVLGRAVCEQLDAVLETPGAGLSVEQREAVAQALAANVAVQLAAVAELILAYPPLQAAVVQAKATGTGLSEARTARNAAAEAIKSSLVDVGRVAAGDDPGKVA